VSYEGSEEYICPNKHYWCIPCQYEAHDTKCPVCGQEAKYQHMIDETNGVRVNAKGETDDPECYTISAPVKVVGYEDKWRVDHYGNRYATQLEIIEPDHEAWELVEDIKRKHDEMVAKRERERRWIIWAGKLDGSSRDTFKVRGEDYSEVYSRQKGGTLCEIVHWTSEGYEVVMFKSEQEAKDQIKILKKECPRYRYTLGNAVEEEVEIEHG
jgi:hypothetical protein